MADGFASATVLASLDAADAERAFGAGAIREDTPPSVTDMVRSAVDTRVWATTAVDVAEGLDRGDFVIFHRAQGVRGVAQVWSVSADREDVRRLTALDDDDLADDRWAVVTLTNFQLPKDLVALAKVGLHDVARRESLYRIEDVSTLTALQERYTTPMFLVQEVVENPLAFDVPPSGGAVPPRKTPADPVETGPTSTPDLGGLADVLTQQYASRDEQTRRGGLVVLAGLLGAIFLLGMVVTVGTAVPGGVGMSTVVRLGLLLFGGGMAVATGTMVVGAWLPRPGLGSLQQTHLQAADVLSADTDVGTRAAIAKRLAREQVQVAQRLERSATWLGGGVALSLFAVTVGLVYLAFGIGAQVEPAIGRYAPVVLVAYPWLVIGVFLAPAFGIAGEWVSTRLGR